MIEVESAAILAIYSANVQNDHVVASLMRDGGSNSVSPSTPAPAASNNENFTTGQRWGTWALNEFVLPGLGSYVIMRDPLGGTIQLMAGGVGTILYIIGIVNILNSTYEVYVYDSYYGGYYETRVDEDQLSRGTGMVVAGAVLVTANFIFNIVRSATYNKPQPKVGSLADPNAWSLAVLPEANGVKQVRLAYTLRY